MWVRVLGAAAGGGFPQWNCNCPQCRAVRDGSRPCRPRTQSSVAVSADYRRWFLLNASPDLRAQIESFPALHPHGLRDSPLQAVLLTDAELDHWEHENKWRLSWAKRPTHRAIANGVASRHASKTSASQRCAELCHDSVPASNR